MSEKRNKMLTMWVTEDEHRRLLERCDGRQLEAEYILYRIFCLRSAAAFLSCHMKHFTDIRIRDNILSQYTLR